MKNLNKPRTLLVTLLTCAVFSAHASWWDTWKSAGDDGNVNTKGNAAAAANKGKTPQAVNKAYVGLVNDTTSTLTSAVLKDKSGKALYTSTPGRTCAAGAVCWLRVAPGLMTKGNTFFFYSNNKLVSALVLDNLPANASLYNIGASMDSLGLYVLNKIRAVNPKVTYTRVDNDIQTTTLSATPYQELADYYLDLMGNSKDNTPQETKVIKALAEQFAKNKMIPANPNTTRLAKSAPGMAKSIKLANGRMALTSSPTITSSGTQDALCSETLNSAMDGLALIPMIGDVVATAAKTAKSASCPSDDQDVKDFMADRFADVDTKLSDISTQLTNLEDQLKSFEQNYNKDKLSEQKENVDELDTEFNPWLKDYQTALLNSKGKDGKQYNTLNELINSFGSFNKALAKNPDLGALLNKLYDDETEYKAIDKLSLKPKFSTAKKDQICSNPDNIAGNVLEIRAACNAVVVAMYSKNIILAKQIEYAYNDIYKVYKLDTRQGKTLITEITPSKFTNWINNIEQMNPEKAITKPINQKEPVYNLANNLMAKGFMINGWYPEKDKRYLDVSYKISEGNWIKSKYAYQHPTTKREEGYDDNGEIDSNIANVMGVPVPERFFTGDGKSQNSYGANEAFPWAYKTELASDTSDKVNDGYHWYNSFNPYADFIVPENGKVAVYAEGFHVGDTIPNVFQDTGGSTSDEKYNGQIYKREVFARINPTTYRVSYHGADWYLIGSGEYFTYMRYTTDGYSYVWAMRTWIETGAYSIALYVAPQCMSNDCYIEKIKDKEQKTDLIRFRNGHAFEWTYANTPGSSKYSINRNFTLNVK